jgi:hypothetical protein
VGLGFEIGFVFAKQVSNVLSLNADAYEEL